MDIKVKSVHSNFFFQKITYIFHKGGPLWFFQFFDEVVKQKPSKMTFSPKKFQGSLRIGITYDLFFVKLKAGQKNLDFFFKFQIFKFQK